MSRRGVFLLLCLWLFLPGNAFALNPLIADLSNYRIDIDSGFNGTRLFLFGARNDIGDVLVVIRGPHKNYIVRKKEKIGGIWVNNDRMKFYHIPDFYAMASNRKLADIEQAALFQQLGIGPLHLFTPPADAKDLPVFQDFSTAFLRYQVGRRLYLRDSGIVQFMGETLFKTVIEFPDDIPPGEYTAEIYLISDGAIIGMQSTPITVVKSGLDAFLYNFAHLHPAWYGMTAIMLALSVGWLAERLFRKM